MSTPKNSIGNRFVHRTGGLFAAWFVFFCQTPVHAEDVLLKAPLALSHPAENLLDAAKFRPYEAGFERADAGFVCDNGPDAKGRRGVTQQVVLNQTRPEPIMASGWSKAEGVTGGSDSNYSIYLDLVYQDGTPLWGQTAPFDSGTHDWQRRQVIVLPDKPIKSVSFYFLFRGHAGKASFRDGRLTVIRAPGGAVPFDGVPVTLPKKPVEGFQIRDVAAESGFFQIQKEAIGLKLDARESRMGDAVFYDVVLTETTGRDRAVTLVYSVPIAPQQLVWLADPCQSRPVGNSEWTQCGRFRAGANGRLSRYPLAAVADTKAGHALGIDMSRPAFFRLGYNAASGEMFLAYDLGFAPEKRTAELRFCKFPFAPDWGFRAALERYYGLFPEHFRCRTPRQGLWMPFAKISKVEGWEDFEFRFKEGNDETAWDDAHEITTFRYTEPMTWWMRMPKDMPRTIDAALAEARRLAEEKKDRAAQSLFTSGYHNESGQFPARLLDTPWCNGAVWSMNSMPGIPGEPTHFQTHWNERIREQFYGPNRKGDLDGEYIDSSEGYVTDELDFRRDHFAAAQTPLCFSPDSRRPAIFRGLIAWEYVRGIERDVRSMGKLMMANGAPTQLCWLMPLIDVAGTETNWNRNGRWTPMSEQDLLYRRALCRGKPYCFLMNTDFEQFPSELVKRYMKRSLAYGMFPGFFSHNASEKQYFQQPALYNRDRPLFKKYVPLCRLAAEAGWEPVTLARSVDGAFRVERFGRRYLTVWNEGSERRTSTIALERLAAKKSRELLSGRAVEWAGGRTTLTLEPEEIALFDLAD